jgi:hypothetical protein
MMRHQFWVRLSDLVELIYKSLRNTGMKGASRFAQQRAVGGVLDQCMLEQIIRVRWQALSEQQTGFNETVK